MLIELIYYNRIFYSHRADGVKTLRMNETRRVTTTVKVNSKGDTIRTERVTYNRQMRQFYGDLVMEDGKTKRIYNEAGYLEFGAAGTAPQYYYHVKDYLGSTRAVLDRYGNQVQGTDYYTGGLPVAPYGSPMSAEERLHMGKEFNAFSGLAWYDNAARSYDPIIPRFLQPDPLAEKYPHLSPYAHCANNPMRFVDLDGKKLEVAGTKVYREQVKKDIQQLVKDNSSVGKIIKDLSVSLNVHRIEMPSEGKIYNSIEYNKTDQKNGTPQGSTIHYDPNKKETASGDNRTPRVGLAHELQHGSDLDKGKLDNETKTETGVPISEVDAVNTENKIREQTGDEKKNTYGGKKNSDKWLDD